MRQDPSAKNIYINEDLTKNKQEILYEIRKLKRKKNIANTWTRDGRVFIKVDGQDNPIEIREKHELNKYEGALDISEIQMGNVRTSSGKEIDKMVQSVLNFTFNSPQSESIDNSDYHYPGDNSETNDPAIQGQMVKSANHKRETEANNGSNVMNGAQ